MEVFLFPLVNVTLFPRTTKPLNIFEPRYIEMVYKSMETMTPIAIGFIEDPAQVTKVNPGNKVSFVREICGYGSPQIIERRDNGTLLIFITGQGKIRLGPVIERELPFLSCEAEIVAEETVLHEVASKSLDSLHQVLSRWVQSHVPDNRQREIFTRNLKGPEEIIGAVSAYLVKDYDMQQLLLELPSLEHKVETLFRLFESNEFSV